MRTRRHVRSCHISRRSRREFAMLTRWTDPERSSRHHPSPRRSRRRVAATRATVVTAAAAVVVALLGGVAIARARVVPPATNGDWTLPGRTPQGTRYSPLNQITTQNVGNLKEVWSYDDSIKDGHEGQPLVVNRTLYMVT